MATFGYHVFTTNHLFTKNHVFTKNQKLIDFRGWPYTRSNLVLVVLHASVIIAYYNTNVKTSLQIQTSISFWYISNRQVWSAATFANKILPKIVQGCNKKPIVTFSMSTVPLGKGANQICVHISNVLVGRTILWQPKLPSSNLFIWEGIAYILG